MAVNTDYRNKIEITAQEASALAMKYSCIGAVYISCELLILDISLGYEQLLFVEP